MEYISRPFPGVTAVRFDRPRNAFLTGSIESPWSAMSGSKPAEATILQIRLSTASTVICMVKARGVLCQQAGCFEERVPAARAAGTPFARV
jgi:hypothetical protein